MDKEYFNSSNYTNDYYYDIMAETKPYTTEIVVNSILLYIGVCTNIWMIRSLYKSWKTASRMHFYLLAICVADFLGLCIRSGVSIGLFATVVWRGGYYGCKIFLGLQMFGATMSHLILAGFNIDNLFAITCSRSIKALRVVFLLLSFVTTFIISAVKFYFYRLMPLGYNNEAYFCAVEGFDLLPLVDTAGHFLLPFLMMLLFGLPSLFVWCCRKGTISFEKMTRDDDSSIDLQFIGRDIGMGFAYDVVFFLCCAPFFALQISGEEIYKYCRSQSLFTVVKVTTTGMVMTNLSLKVDSWILNRSQSAIVFTALTFLEAANPCLNPFIYAIISCIGRRRDRTSPGL